MVLKRKTGDLTSEEKRKQKTFTLKAKHEIIKFYEGEMKTMRLLMNLTHITVETIIKDKK